MNLCGCKKPSRSDEITTKDNWIDTNADWIRNRSSCYNRLLFNKYLCPLKYTHVHWLPCISSDKLVGRFLASVRWPYVHFMRMVWILIDDSIRRWPTQLLSPLLSFFTSIGQRYFVFFSDSGLCMEFFLRNASILNINYNNNYVSLVLDALVFILNHLEMLKRDSD